MKLVHTQPDPLPLIPLRWERLNYMWEHLMEDKEAYCDYTPLTWDEFVAVTMSPISMSWEIGDGVGLSTLIFQRPNAILHMVMFDWKFRPYLIDNVVQKAFANGATRVTNFIAEGGISAKKLAKLFGGVYEGRIRQAFRRGDKLVDFEIYGCLKEEYHGLDHFGE